MDAWRYRRITFFFARVIAGFVFWDLFLARIGFKRWAEHSRSKRLQKIARDYHALAVRMGGVLIKVGQFLSARADVLPEEITTELAGLQDEVPPEDFKAIRSLAEAELGAKLEETFAQFDVEPMAAASLGQVHRAKLNTSPEEENSAVVDVVVKIQRPNIEEIINVDMAAFNKVGKWVMRYEPIRRRANVPAILAEFSRILYEEIDYMAEGRNAETFAENFEGAEGICVPRVLWTHTTKRVLTLEDVYAIKITDYSEIEAAGVARNAVAVRLFDTYMQQIFNDGFFHADPHPGNLFVQPDEGENGWQLTFVDFGMVGHVPPNARAGLRELAIALATQDSSRLVKSYQMLHVLLPHADLELIARAESLAFDRFWGKSMDELKQISFEEMHEVAKEFRELVYAMPFQVPQDLVFLFRTVAILSGICTGLDPDFNFWEVLTPYAKKLLAEEAGSNWEYWLSEIGGYAQTLIGLPRKADKVLGKLERGEIALKLPATETQLQRVNRTLNRLVSTILFLAFLTNGVWLYINQEYVPAAILAFGAILSLVGIPLSREK
jgi:predicted unusual protein kinase regulating ubiquinone biosynthesis (AarF/ABC1/UbiB family)